MTSITLNICHYKRLYNFKLKTKISMIWNIIKPIAQSTLACTGEQNINKLSSYSVLRKGLKVVRSKKFNSPPPHQNYLKKSNTNTICHLYNIR